MARKKRSDSLMPRAISEWDEGLLPTPEQMNLDTEKYHYYWVDHTDKSLVQARLSQGYKFVNALTFPQLAGFVMESRIHEGTEMSGAIVKNELALMYIEQERFEDRMLHEQGKADEQMQIVDATTMNDIRGTGAQTYTPTGHSNRITVIN